jgi:outer membrane immunogenic protein
MKMRWTSGMAVLPVVFAGPALAAPPPPIYNWTGFYVGANVGAAWGRVGSSTTTDCSGSPPGIPFYYYCGPLFPGDATGVNSAGSGTINTTGFTGGVQAGYNWQVSNVVVGLESDFGAFKLQGQRQGSGTLDQSWGGLPFTINTWANTDWLFTFRGRVGATVRPDLLVYVTGGLAVTRLYTRTSYADNNTLSFPPGVTGNWGGSAIRTGYAVGAGAEYALSNAWTVKAEYLYLNFGGSLVHSGIISDSFGAYGQALSTRVDLTAQIARIGVNRRF